MKHYKVTIQRRFPNEDKVLGHANGQFVSNGKENFSRIRNGEILTNTPVFDYFYLQSFGTKDEWDWKLQDIHGGVGDYPGGGNWYISDKFKLVLENFRIASDYNFYETRLLYKGEKIKYWIFQFIASYGKLNKMNFIDFNNSIFFSNKNQYIFNSYNEYLKENEKNYDKYEMDLEIKKVSLTTFFDFIPLNPISSDIVISENLKQTMIKMGLIGFDFLDLGYDFLTP